ncbi:caspase family protein [Roseobacter litoralis]|uniref:caspase family protein n=1 Tax=Roseobacter litoralis TaxID=42443 RepID=UPI002494ABAA|nr:caspase family protein [Roseobacter litoralis]
MAISTKLDRREVLIGGATLFGSLGTTASIAQPVTTEAKRAAVVIGLDKTPGLPDLRAAVAGAHEMADFLKQGGFDVSLFTDEQNNLVRAHHVADEIEGLVELGILDQLVIYFAGHGTLAGTSEYWLLSKAATQSSEAISVWETFFFAKQSGIPNVVLISDACRSVAKTLNLSGITGQPVFPSAITVNSDVDVQVDLFLAAKMGRAALELPAATSVAQHEGIFTTAFLKAFREPDSNMIVALPSGSYVVPNRKLEKFLVREVKARAQDYSFKLNQVPDAMVESDLPTFIARSAIAPAESVAGQDMDLSEASVTNAVSDIFQRVAIEGIDYGASITRASASSNEQEAGQLIIDAAFRNADDFVLERTGLVAYGRRIRSIVGPGIEGARKVDEGDRFDAWEVDLGFEPGASVLVTFDDGSGTVAALIRDFGVHMTVDEFGIKDLRYTPAGFRFEFADPVALLRALAAEATRNGALRFEGSTKEREFAAEQFARQIRMGKSADPTLGIYAAYAYAIASSDLGAKSVHEIMHDSFGGLALYDTVLASGLFDEVCSKPSPISPAAPMLRQGWELVRPRNAPLSAAFVVARPFLTDSLWTTFSERGMAILANASEDQVFQVCLEI